MNSTLVGVFFAVALMVAALSLGHAWENSHKVITDPIAQRISVLSTDIGGEAYANMVENIMKAKKDTIIIYRDTCK